MTRLSSGTSARRGIHASILIVTAALVGACDRHMTTATIPDDYRQRHPISLTRANETLEVFTGRNGGKLDRRQTEDVRGFARGYMETGEGPLIAYLPAGANGHEVNQGLAAIRSALAGGGAAGRLHIAHYHPEQHGVAPIRLAYAKLKAGTDTVCNYADGDAIPTRFRDTNANLQPFAFGCAYQKNLAAQVADPRDLVRPRVEGPIDVERRTTGIERIRENEAQELKPGGKSLKTLVTE
jgi:pilus assembly protein CpaD